MDKPIFIGGFTISDEIIDITPEMYEYLLSKVEAQRNAAGHAAGGPQPSADRAKNPPLDDNADDSRRR